MSESLTYLVCLSILYVPCSQRGKYWHLNNFPHLIRLLLSSCCLLFLSTYAVGSKRGVREHGDGVLVDLFKVDDFDPVLYTLEAPFLFPRSEGLLEDLLKLGFKAANSFAKFFTFVLSNLSDNLKSSICMGNYN